MATTLRDLARRHFNPNGYTPNAGETVVREIVDSSASVTKFVRDLQAGANDLGRWTESEWKDVLTAEFGIDEEYMSDAMEQVASWGVVDDDYYYAEEETSARK